VKSQRRKTTLSMLLMAIAAALLSACAVDMDAKQEAQTEQSVLAPEGQTPEPTPEDLMVSMNSSGDEATPRVSCRRVTASSIPVFTATNSNTVRCRFFAGDVFSHFGFVQSPGFSLRVITWCPRGVPPSQGTTSYAQVSGTVDGGCG
jgi:hypothetical protein